MVTDSVDLSAASELFGVTFESETVLDFLAGATFDFTLGLDLRPGLTAEESFFIDVRVLCFDVAVQSSDIDVGITLGGVSAEIANGVLDLQAQLDILFNDITGDNRLSLSDMQELGFDELIEVDATGSLYAVLPLSAEFDGYSTAQFGIPTVFVETCDLFNSLPDITIDVALNQQLKDAVLKVLEGFDSQVGGSLGTPETVLNTPIPVLGKSLNQVLQEELNVV